MSGTIGVEELNDSAHKPGKFWFALTKDGLRMWVFMRHYMNASTVQKNRMLASLTWLEPCPTGLTVDDAFGLGFN